MKRYSFCFSGQSEPKQGEEDIYIDVFVKMTCVVSTVKFLLYYIDNQIDNEDTVNTNNICVITEDATFLLISTNNSAHSISEIISFINYYKNNNSNNIVVISDYVLNFLPLLYDLIKLFIDNDKIIVLNNNTIYKFNKLITYRNYHFNYIKDWGAVKFSKNDNIIKFEDINYIKYNFSLDTLFLFDKIEEIYKKHKNDFELFENIMLIKTTNDINSATLERSILYPNKNIMDIINQNNIQFLSISYFKNIIHFICILYHAKNVIFSYGGPCCTNRYFCNPQANVIVLGNLHYKHEYEFNNDSQNYWHIRHSHLCPVKMQYFLLHFENELNENNINKILQFIN
jgi:hypothetical protein